MSSGPERRRSLEQALQLALGGVVLLVLLALALGGILAVRNLASDFVTTRLEHDAEALAICTVSDDIPSGAALTSDERATTFDEMILVALETVIA